MTQRKVDSPWALDDTQRAARALFVRCFPRRGDLATDEAAPGSSGSGRLRIIEPTQPWIA